jgi:asparagine synthase (glutamine-hydrolysing)
MFAFVMWDSHKRELSLVRDRMGIKPVYYGWAGRVFLFGSELKALQPHPAFKPEIDREVVKLYMRHHCVPAPYSIYRGIRQLPPGCILTISNNGDQEAHPKPYWSLKTIAEQGLANPFTGSEKEAIAELERLLCEAVGLRMIADVPLGAFLSGGIDSSTVVALMQTQSRQPIKTFSIGFHEANYNEAGYAKAVAQHLGTSHTELYVSPIEAMAVIPKLPEIYDEPFSDDSQIPTYLVSQLTRQHVTVSLSGDGGDELFGGYQRYFLADAIWKNLGWLPAMVRQGLGKGISAVDPAIYDGWLGWLKGYTVYSGRHGQVGDKLHKLADILLAGSQEQLYSRLALSGWRDTDRLFQEDFELSSGLGYARPPAKLPNFMRRMMFADLTGYLPDVILTKVDRASMAHSLEARVPLLDHRVVEFAWRLPLSLMVRKQQGKWILRQVLYKYVPRELVERRKMGFAVPIGSWLRGSLREWAEDLLDETRLRREGFFNPKPVRAKWAEHLSGRRDWEYCLWDVLMFQAWLERWG